MSIKWLTTVINPPQAEREIIAKNTSKETSANSSSKQCKVMKFHKSFDEHMIVNLMLSENLTVWSYTEGSDT